MLRNADQGHANGVRFPDWDGQTRLERDGKVFSTIINLVPGKHSYKFVINGET